MKLSQAIRFHDFSAVACIYVPFKAFVYINKQGRYKEWWTVSIHPIERNTIETTLWSYNVASSKSASFDSIDECYQWLKRYYVSPFYGWYPARKYQKWWQLGSE